jgi:hypothetical protein
LLLALLAFLKSATTIDYCPKRNKIAIRVGTREAATMGPRSMPDVSKALGRKVSRISRIGKVANAIAARGKA